MNYPLLLSETETYVNRFVQEHNNPALLYHNIDHIKSVVTAAAEIANHYQLNEHDFFVVLCAAWFHDLGYYTGTPQDHESRSANLAEDFLKEKNIDQPTIEQVKNCILATRIPQQTTNLLEEIVADADLFHLGTSEFSSRNKLMRKEAEAITNKKVNKKEWLQGTIHLLEQHHYHTTYSNLLLSDTKKENLHKLLKKQEEQHIESAIVTHTEEKTVPKETTTKKDKDLTPSRGIETMFRITSGNNQRLSDMADNKAQILITVNSIILSAIISLVLRKLDESSFLTYPTFLLIAISLLTIVISILATRPVIPPGVFTKKDIDDKKVNLLFFGNFYKMNLEEYAAGMNIVMTDREFLYGTLVKDIYSQGVSLGRKYRLLRLAYTIFMFGLILSVIGYVAAVIIYK